MKKKFAALFCAAVLAAGLPSLAFADSYGSPTGKGTATSNGVSVAISGGGFDGTDGKIIVEASNVAASGVPSDVTPVASFTIEKEGEVTVDADHPLTVTFNVGASNAGKFARLYIQHGDGSSESNGRFVESDGSFQITVNKLSVYSIVLYDDSAAPRDDSADATVAADKSAKSPQTGADMGFAFGGAVVAIAGAGCAAYALRKKIVE